MKSATIGMSLVGLLLGGCASFHESFKEPASGPTASIRYATSVKESGNVGVYVVSGGGDCGTASLQNKNLRYVAWLHGPAITHDRKALGMPAADGRNPVDFTESRIPAGVPFAFDMALHNRSGGPSAGPGTFTINTFNCNVTTDFVPRPGALYEAVYSLEGDSCRVAVAELVSTGGGYQRVAEKSAHPHAPRCSWK